jgi:hypothetical protein
MNVAQVIEELSKLPPYLPVRGFMSTVYVADEFGETEVHPVDTEAQEVTDIKWRGHDVCLECDGMCAG